MLEYALITVGIIALGDAAFVPAVYLALQGHLNLGIIILISFLVSNIMDIWWYFLGTKGLQRVFKSLPFIEKWEKKHPELMAMFTKHQLKIVFWSRFLHGSGVSIMVLSGIYKVPFKKYMLMNLLSSIIVIVSVPLVIFLAKQGADAVFYKIHIAEAIIALGVILIFAFSQFEIKEAVTRFLLGKGKEGDTEGDRNV